MGRVDLPYLELIVSKGRPYHYYRRAGHRQRIDGEPGSIEFMECYQRIHESFEAPGKGAPGPGTFDALVTAYYGSPEFKQLKASTRKTYRWHLEPLREAHGNSSMLRLTKAIVYQIQDSLGDTPTKANNTIRALRQVINWAIARTMLRDNPAAGIKPLKTGPGWKQWPDAAIDRFKRDSRGASRIAGMLALYTGQRRADVLKMRWSDIRGDTVNVANAVNVVQEKTEEPLEVPVHPTLAKELAKVERKGVYIVGRKDGKPYTENGFGSVWRREKIRIGLKPVQFHGLRKNATAMLFEAGCTPQEVMAITGHKTLAMVARYGRDARQKRLAKRAMLKLVRNDE